MPQNKIQRWVDTEVKKELDKEPFSSLPLKMRIGIFILVFSFILGYGLPPLIILIAGSNNKLAAGFFGGTFFYIISWIPGVAGLALAGKDSIKYPIYFFAKLLKKIYPAYFDEDGGELSLFALSTSAAVFLLLIFGALSIFRYSIYWLLCMGAVIVIHQSLYIYGMFSYRSDYFFKTIKGEEYFNGKPGVLFRFDDGPDPEYTPRILDILKGNSIRALFAITGENAEKYPDIVARIHKENHIIANHTYSHPYNILLLGYERIRGEIVKTNRIIKKLTGQEPVFFCPPMGQKNPVIGKALRELGLKPLMWDIRTCDTQYSTKKIVKTTRKKLGISSIILFHDGILPWSKKDRESTIEALQIIAGLSKSEECIKN